MRKIVRNLKIKINKNIIPNVLIESKIYLIRGKEVMLDRDLAMLYGIETKKLKQQVKRNSERFPSDFMIELTKKEFYKWRSQFVTSISDKMGLRIPPFAFSEHGILMLSSILKSKKAIDVNIQIMRTFVKLRKMLATNDLMKKKIFEMEKKYDKQFQTIFQIIYRLIQEDEKPKKRIGFKTN
jgi:hypothetical protein